MKTKHGVEINEMMSWKDISPGGTISQSGSAQYFYTGDWRTMRPIWIKENCKQCLLCVPVCPDSSIVVSEKQRGEFAYDYCKGCGICAKVCPFKAIDFVKEVQNG